MESRYELLTRITYKHAYFFDRKFDKIITAPDPATQTALDRHGLLFRAAADGFYLLFDTRHGGAVRERDSVLGEKVDLLFPLTLKDPDFYHYTDLERGDITRSFFYLSNVSPEGKQRPAAVPAEMPADQEAAKEQTEPGLLHDQDIITEDDRIYFGKLPRHFSGKPFGWLFLVLAPQLKLSYEARWPVRSVYWNYIVVSQHLRELNKPAIIDPATKQVFSGPKPILLPDSRSALSFVSEKPISFAAGEKKLFQLVENFEADSGKYKVVLSALPRANPHVLSDGCGMGANYSEIFIY